MDLFGYEDEPKIKRKLRILQKNVYSFHKNNINKKYEIKFSLTKMKELINDSILMLFTLKYLHATKMSDINDRFYNTNNYYRSMENMINYS